MLKIAAIVPFCQDPGKCYPQKCVFLRIRAYPQKCLRRSDFWQKKAKLSRFFGEMPDQSCLYWWLPVG